MRASGSRLTASDVLAAVRVAAQEAAQAGELPAFLAELERVRAEVLLEARPAPPPPAEASGMRLLTPQEAADRLGRSRWWVYQNKGALPVKRLQTGGYGFPSDQLDEWIRRRPR